MLLTTSWAESLRRAAPVITRRVSWGALAARMVRPPLAPDLPLVCSAACCEVRWRLPGRCPRCDAELVPDKRSLPAWSPWMFRDDRRGLASAVTSSCLVVDYDEGVDVDAARARWADWPHVGHTSWSHRPAAPKVRVIVPLAEPIPARVWGRVWTWSTAHDDRQDLQIGDPGRCYFLPFQRVGFTAWLHDEPSSLLAVDWSRLPPHPDEALVEGPRPDAAPARNLRPNRGPVYGTLRYALRTDPDARRTWGLELGGALHGEGAQARIKGVRCPKCGRPGVWWLLAPRSWPGAACEHKSSCGWTGWLDNLSPNPTPV